MNQTILSARIAEAQALRYTPAGLPALDLRLEHESQANEAGQARQVKVAVKAVAFGATAEALKARYGSEASKRVEDAQKTTGPSESVLMQVVKKIVPLNATFLTCFSMGGPKRLRPFEMRCVIIKKRRPRRRDENIWKLFMVMFIG